LGDDTVTSFDSIFIFYVANSFILYRTLNNIYISYSQVVFS